MKLKLFSGMRNTVFALSCFLAFNSHGQSVFIGAPNSLRHSFGNAVQDRPFGDTVENDRYQQVYAASELGAISNGGAVIHSIFFRSRRALSGTVSNMQITLSTTTKAPDSLSPVFAENFGTDATVVVNPRTLTWNGGDGETPGYDIFILLDTPFFYNPAEGNLLLDFQRTRSLIGHAILLDAEETFGDGISSIFSVGTSPVADFVSTRGLTTGFFVEPVPEPSTAVILMSAIIFGVGFYRRRNVPC